MIFSEGPSLIAIPELGDDQHEMWLALMKLAHDPPAPWTLIGAHMVALHGWERGRQQVRPSTDADVLVDVRAVTNGTVELSRALTQQEFKLDGVTPQGIGHRFVKGGVTFDVLAPDGLGERANVQTVPPARTVRVPGGTQALSRSEPVEIRSRRVSGTVPRPNLIGALLVKSRAIVVDDQPEAQQADVAFLLSLVEDPDAIRQELSSAERGWLKRHAEFSEPGSGCYRGIANAEDAAIVFRRLVGL